MTAALTWALRAAAFHKTRTALSVASVALASALLTGTLAFHRGYASALERDIGAMGYQLLVTGKGCPHEAATLILRGGSIPMYVLQGAADRLARRPEVRDTTRFLMQAVSGPDGRSVQVFVGIDERFLPLKPGVTFQRGKWFSSPGAKEAIVGYNVAEYRRLGLGDVIRARGADLTVVGVLDKLGTQDDGTVFLPLAVSQVLFEKRDRLTGVGILLKDPDRAADFIERVYEEPSVQVVRLSQVHESMLRTLAGVRSLLLAFSGLCLAAALAGVFNVSLLAAAERRPEMGVLRAMGCSRPGLFLLAWCETLLVGLAGALAGTALAAASGAAAAAALSAWLPFLPVGGLIAVTPALALANAAIVVSLCLLAGAVPAFQSARAAPLESIRGAS